MMSRYVNTKGVIWGSVGSMIIVGIIMVGAQTLPKHPALPTRTDGCSFEFNVTSPEVAKAAVDDVPLVFKLSFMYYTLLGTILLILIAYVVSFFTGGCEPFDERLLAPFRRDKNWKPDQKPAVHKEVLYKEVHQLEELKRLALIKRRVSIDVA